jgi:hypothetical protein
MKSNEVRIAEAVAALRSRLEAWAAPDPHTKAIELLREMQALGWRPVIPDDRPLASGHRAHPDTAHQYAQACRAAIRTATDTGGTHQ